MGKVKDETSASKPGKPRGNGGSKSSPSRFGPFLANLTRTDLYKPTQGRQARIWTAVALGVVVAIGLWRLTEVLDGYRDTTRLGLPAAVGVVLGWFLYRLVNFPPFADFLVATEAEMNKVSWTTWNDLKRATGVVLSTVLLISIFLFGVDWVWSNLLQLIGVLKFSGAGAFGSQAG